MPSIPWKPFGFGSPAPRRFPRVRRGNKRQPIVPHKEWKVVRGDTVMLLAGKDKGKIGEISEVVRSKNWVFVQGLNCHQRYLKPRGDYAGGFFPSEAPLQVTEVSLIDPTDKKPTDIVYRYTDKGEKVRVSERTGRIIPKPEWERRDWKSRTSVKDGDFDTPGEAAAKETYVPSLLYFHEEIMHALKIKPTVTKHEPERRDLMMKEIEKAAGWSVEGGKIHTEELGLFNRAYFGFLNLMHRMTNRGV